ncbi:hypothetical protein BJ508DRAFT_366480 [Ascobolus immersus RN42]|uniref:Uncharacterized protein n=1 Tax=Ascobolus immersus RN42 TaxID=1160509 RepID=A0A3N4HQ81_ASCIM|nr:hypothetical protein BJ508DRAFT_366480 [Ascobolus immersus RN42]
MADHSGTSVICAYTLVKYAPATINWIPASSPQFDPYHSRQCRRLELPDFERHGCWCTMNLHPSDVISLEDQTQEEFHLFLLSCPLSFVMPKVSRILVLKSCDDAITYFNQAILEPVLPFLQKLHTLAYGEYKDTAWEMRVQHYAENGINECRLVSSQLERGVQYTLLTIAALPPNALLPTLFTLKAQEVPKGVVWKQLSALIRSYSRCQRPIEDSKSHYTNEQPQRQLLLTDGVGFMIIRFKAGKIRMNYGSLSRLQPEGEGLVPKGMKTIRSAKEAVVFAIYKALEEDMGFDELHGLYAVEDRWKSICLEKGWDLIDVWSPEPSVSEVKMEVKGAETKKTSEMESEGERNAEEDWAEDLGYYLSGSESSFEEVSADSDLDFDIESLPDN